MKRIDTSGFSCPEPVIMTKKALKDSPDALMVIVDNVASLYWQGSHHLPQPL